MNKILILSFLLTCLSTCAFAQEDNCKMLFEYYNSTDNRSGKSLEIIQQEKKEELSVLNEKVKEIKRKKKNLFLGIAAGAVAVAGAAAAVAVGSSKNNSSSSSSDYSSSSYSSSSATSAAKSGVVTNQRVIVSNGNQASNAEGTIVYGTTLRNETILLKISGGKVTSICTGNDYEGKQNWETIPAVQYRSNSRNIGSSDGSLSSMLMGKEYEVTINGTRIWFNK